jgi:predicted Fe-Mo cluster-binding NifX family protein
MRTAIPSWQGRVSPVFDEASRILLVDVAERQEQRRQEVPLIAQNPLERAQLLPRLGVDLLICGMISQTLLTALASAGIRVIPHICGSMEDVISALLRGQIQTGALRMPGCGGRRRLRRHIAKLRG